MIIVSFLIYLLFAIFLSISAYGRINFSKFIQVFFLSCFGLNILIYSGLDVFKAIDRSFLFLCLQIIICLLLVLIIRHRWPLSIQEYLDRLKIPQSGFKWFDFVLVFIMGGILIAFFIVGITTPPNNMDSLDPTGVTRIFYWLQQGSITSSLYTNLPGIFDPKFVHIQGLWLFSLGKSEYLFFLVQWCSLAIATVTIFRISRALGFSITNSLISGLIGLSMPVVLMQTYSFQGDLTVAVFILVSISFIFDWLNSKAKLDLVTAVLALLFALGSKRAAYLALPALGIIVLFWWISQIKNQKIKSRLTMAVLIILSITLIGLGSFLFRGGSVLADLPIFADSQLTKGSIIEKINYNAPRYLYQLIGLDGLPRVLQNDLIPIKADVFQKVLLPSSKNLQSEEYLQPGFDEIEKFSFTTPLILSEENAWFGPIGFLLIPLSCVISLFSKNKKRRLYTFFGLALFFSFFLLVIIQRPGWDPYQGRYFILPVLPLIPLVSILFPSKRIWQIPLIVLILPLSLFLSINTFLANNSKPVVTAGSLWGFQYQHLLILPENNKYERFFKNKMITSFDHIATAALDRRTIYQCTYWEQVYYSGYRMLGNIQFIDPLIPDEATLFLNIPATALDYGLFGRQKDRTLVRVDNINQVSSGYFLTPSASTIDPTKKMELIGDNGVYKIYRIK